MSPESRAALSYGFHIVGKQSRRSACDRCREQKLRCVYQDPRILACERCLRGNIPCTYDHSGTNTKRKQHKSGVEACETAAIPPVYTVEDQQSYPPHGEQKARHLPSASVSSSSGISISNTIDLDPSPEQWSLSMGFDESFLNLDEFRSTTPADFDVDCDAHDSESMETSCQQRLQGVGGSQTQFHQDAIRYTSKETMVQALHALDLRVCNILAVFESLQRQHHSSAAFKCNAEQQPMRELLNASQAFVDLLSIVRGRDGTIHPGSMLVATVYARLLSAYSELFVFIIHNLPNYDAGSDSMFGTPPSQMTARMCGTPGDILAQLCAGVDLRLMGVNVQDEVNLSMRILVETCTFMLDKLEDQFKVPATTNSWTEFAAGLLHPEPCSPEPDILDLIAIATRYDDRVCQGSGRTSISSIRKNVQHLKGILRAS